MKIIFLDIDGVILPNWPQWINRLYFPFWIVGILNRIILETEAKIVISSMWRYRFTFQQLKDIFSLNGVDSNCIIGTTGIVRSTSLTMIVHAKSRSDEIREWLEQHPDIEQFVILDDENIIGFDDNFVKCDDGLDRNEAEKVIEILNAVAGGQSLKGE